MRRVAAPMRSGYTAAEPSHSAIRRKVELSLTATVPSTGPISSAASSRPRPATNCTSTGRPSTAETGTKSSAISSEPVRMRPSEPATTPAPSSSHNAAIPRTGRPPIRLYPQQAAISLSLSAAHTTPPGEKLSAPASMWIISAWSAAPR